MVTEDNSEEWLGLRQAAAYLGAVSEKLLRKLIAEGQGPVHYRVGRNFKFHVEDLDEWFLALRVEQDGDESLDAHEEAQAS